MLEIYADADFDGGWHDKTKLVVVEKGNKDVTY
jgi:hypothetical protein